MRPTDKETVHLTLLLHWMKEADERVLINGSFSRRVRIIEIM